MNTVLTSLFLRFLPFLRFGAFLTAFLWAMGANSGYIVTATFANPVSGTSMICPGDAACDPPVNDRTTKVTWGDPFEVGDTSSFLMFTGVDCSDDTVAGCLLEADVFGTAPAIPGLGFILGNFSFFNGKIAAGTGITSIFLNLTVVFDDETRADVDLFAEVNPINNTSNLEGVPSNERFEHPSYWAPYLLIGNWL